MFKGGKEWICFQYGESYILGIFSLQSAIAWFLEHKNTIIPLHIPLSNTDTQILYRVWNISISTRSDFHYTLLELIR